MFRQLNHAESKAVLDNVRKNKIIGPHHGMSPAMEYSVRYFHDGNFTTAVVKRGELIYAGTSKRNPTDETRPGVGNIVAFVRALHSYPGQDKNAVHPGAVINPTPSAQASVPFTSKGSSIY